MFKKYNYITVLVFGLFFIFSCKREDSFKQFLAGGEKIYPGAVTGVKTYSGNKRVMLKWVTGIDNRINSYKVFWNNGNDSIQLDASNYKAGDTVTCYINNLAESNYTFTVNSYDVAGNKSVAKELPPVIVYGPQYQSTLLNRSIKNVNYSDAGKILTINWGVPDTINISTEISFTDTLGISKTMALGSDASVSVIPWRLGTKIYYKSAYKPVNDALDTFSVTHRDSVLVQNIPVSKALWKKVNLPNDIAADGYGTNLAYIWDGVPGGYPNIYHSEGGSIPHHFTIDMGGLYQLSMFEETGRQDCACHNPVDFEVWGIADTASASTILPGNDPGWKNESINKGWVLLGEVIRTDNGVTPYKVNLTNNTATVRYIRIRVLKTRDNNIESHMSEISFWYNP